MSGWRRAPSVVARGSGLARARCLCARCGPTHFDLVLDADVNLKGWVGGVEDCILFAEGGVWSPRGEVKSCCAGMSRPSQTFPEEAYGLKQTAGLTTVVDWSPMNYEIRIFQLCVIHRN